MNAVGQVTAIGGVANNAATGGANTTAGAGGNVNQAQFEQMMMQAGAAIGGMVIMPMIMKLIKRPGEG